MDSKFEKIDLTCPRCHGTMNIEEEENALVCPFCRHKIILENEESIEELAEKERQLSYARTEGTNLAYEKAERRKKRRTFIMTFSILLFLGIIMFIIVKVADASKPVIEDPFEKIHYDFSGINGEGKINIKIDSSISNNIEYTLSKDKNLSNGEVITIKLKSIQNKLGSTEKNIEVTGLYKRLTSLKELTKEMKEDIHKKSYEYQKNKIEQASSLRGTLVGLEKYKMYLSTDGNNKNILYDVYTAKIKAKSGDVFSKYVVTYYSNVVLINKQNDLLRYENMYYLGSVIAAGDPKIINSMNSNYAGFITGFQSISDMENKLKNNTNTDMQLFEE